MMNSNKTALASLAVLGAVACGGDSSMQLGSRFLASASVGSDGGGFDVDDGSALDGLSLEVPAGALDEEVTLGVTPSVNLPVEQNIDWIGPAADFGPDGQQFAVPVRITMPLSQSLSDGEAVVRVISADGTQELLSGASVQVSAGSVSFEIDHFTRFQPGRQPSGQCTSDADCPQGEECSPNRSCVPSQTGCTVNADCAANEVCAQTATGGACVVGECTADADCAQDEECSPNYTCELAPECRTDADCPQGEECSTAQTCVPVRTGCTTNGDCAMNEVCLRNALGPGMCIVGECTSDAECAAGEECSPNYVCVTVPQCRSNADCAPGEVCRTDGTCGQPPQCQTDQDCIQSQLGRTCTRGICI
ncbi:MAG: hypothetical protein AAF851_13590 [Myxococcota bacterium]